MTKVHDGLALGGPLDGKRITSVSGRYKVAERNTLPYHIPIYSEAYLDAALINADVFEYIHYETPGGDVWLPSDVMSGKRYDHKIWSHPLEFVFSQLIKGYRPEGY